jgi:hypothetical protein
VDDVALLPVWRERLPPGWRPSREPVVDHLYSIRAGGAVAGTRVRRYYLVFSGSAQLARTLDEGMALELFESAVSFDVASSSERWVFVHAGAVGWHGRAILVPAPSQHGKSTLVEALVRAGATYYSDEFAVIDARGRVHPFAKPLSLRLDSGGVRRIRVPEIGGSVGRNPLSIGIIVSTRYVEGQRWQPRAAAGGEALLALLANTVRARLAPRQTLQVLARAVERATLFDGPRGDADRAAHELLRGGLADVWRDPVSVPPVAVRAGHRGEEPRSTTQEGDSGGP